MKPCISCQLPHVERQGACVWAPPQLSIPQEACCFGFVARHIRANRQVPRSYPVLPDKKRSHGDVPGTYQIRMEAVMAILTDKEQTLVRTIGFAGMPAQRTSLTRIMSIDFDRHTLMQES